MTITEKEVYTVKEIAQMRKQSHQAVHQRARRRGIVGKRIGFMRVFSKDEMERLTAPEKGKE